MVVVSLEGGEGPIGRVIRIVLLTIILGSVAGGIVIYLHAQADRSKREKIAAQHADVEAHKTKAQRKLDHDLWAAGMANRKDMQRRIPGVQLGPPPPEPPKP